MRITRLVTTLLVAVPMLGSCRSDEKLNAPAVSDPMFVRYAALGNSITAGFQSAGISDSTQLRAYVQLLAKAMGTTFNYPRLNGRGCPPPWTNNTTGARVGGGLPTTCDLRVPVSGLLNNLAVPGNATGTLLSNFGGLPSQFDPLKTIFLGGRTEVELMQQLQPTFVSVWIGNNDVLGALISLTNPGDPAQVTSPTQFAAQYDSLLDAIEGTGARAIALSVAEVSVIPYASRGSTYWCIKNQPACGTFPAALPAAFAVNNNCAPILAIPTAKGDSTLVPWPIFVPKIAAAALGGVADTLDCTADAEVIVASEYANMRTAVAAYNAHIQSEAAARGIAYFDVNPTLEAQVQSPTNPTGLIPAFPDLAPALGGGSVGFGPLFSLDGVHPSSLTHQIVADSVASTINSFFGPGGTADLVTLLPIPVCGTVSCPAP
ncbi:MAG: SGNH/GDSL hydrolase family protein [Gemmatimonadales bacterium]